MLTEANYTKIIRTILEVFKRPLEDPDIIGGELLNQVSSLSQVSLILILTLEGLIREKTNSVT